jgi:hypothetical protein
MQPSPESGPARATCFSSTELHANAKTAANEIPAGQDAYLIDFKSSSKIARIDRSSMPASCEK